jgi:hypothetical protein
MASSATKVVLVYGKSLQRRLARLLKSKLTALPLWGPFHSVILFLLHEDSLSNRDKKYKFRKILIFVAHSQSMFYQKKKSEIAVLQDLMLQAALLMMGMDMENGYDSMYYQNHHFWAKIPTKAKAVMKEHESCMSQKIQNRGTKTAALQ